MKKRVTKINDPKFDAFLKKHKVKTKFIKNCNNPDVNPYVLNSEEYTIGFIKNMESEEVERSIIMGSFLWRQAPEGGDFWSRLDELYRTE
jgi:hypothetical protein